MLEVHNLIHLSKVILELMGSALDTTTLCSLVEEIWKKLYPTGSSSRSDVIPVNFRSHILY